MVKSLRVGELPGLGVDEEDGDVVGAEIADEEEAVVGRDGGAVGVGMVLTGGVGAECAEFLVVFEVDAVDWLAESAVGLDAVGGDGGAEVVGDEGGVAGGVDGDVGGACSAGGDLACLVEGAGLRVDGEGGGGGGGVVDGVDGVEEASAWPDGSDGEEGWPGGGGSKDRRGQLPAGGVKVRLIDALADALGGVGAEVDGEGRRRGPASSLRKVPCGLRRAPRPRRQERGRGIYGG